VPPIVIHRRQFVLGPEPWREHPDWSVVELPGLGVLSSCPTLPVQVVSAADGVSWALLGLALQSDPARPDPAAEIAATTSSDVSRLSATWAGRWVIAGDGKVYSDAGALLGCYYWRKPAEAGSGVWVSSSSALLGRAAAAYGAAPSPHELAHGRGLDWFPPPQSRFSSVRRLLPSRLLNLGTGQPEPRAWLPDIATGLSYDAALAELEQRLVTPLKKLPVRAGTTVWVPLTAGFDSRLVLAAAMRAGLPVRTYTNYRRRLSLADLELPPHLARAAGVPHEWHRPGRVRPEAERAYDEHSGGETAGVDRGYFARGQWDFAREGDIVLRGGCFEVGRCYYYRRLPAPTGPRPPDAVTIAQGLREAPGTPAAHALAEWIAAAEQIPVPGLDWRDRFYLEQRLAGWLSALEQSLDITVAERVHVANAGATYAVLLGLPENVRASGQHQRDLVARLAPPLAEFPFNPPEEAFGRLSRLGYRLRSDPRALVRSVLRRFGAG
jgi:hypothetical protein